MPDLFVTFQQTGDIPSRNHLHAIHAAFSFDPTQFQVVAYGKDFDSPLLELADVLRRTGRMIYARLANDERRTFLLHQIVDGIAAQQDCQVSAGILQVPR